MWIFWLIVSIVFSVAEMAYNGFFLIWFAVGALAALITTFFTSNVIIQSTVFLIISALLLFTLTKKFSKKSGHKNMIPTHIDALIGRNGVVLENIDPEQKTGLVKLDGEIWTALSLNGEVIPRGTIVTAKQIRGVRLFVSPSQS